jgi:ribonuclease T1
MRFRLPWLICLLGLVFSGLVSSALARAPQGAAHATPPGQGAGHLAWIERADLPAEARTTLRLIEQGGPFPYARDGIVFGNHEKRLPVQPRGHYREYTVPTPGIRHRGARRIVHGGGRDSTENYYTADHYRSFHRIRP